MVRELECSFGMPFSSFVVTFFIVFGGRTMSARSKFVLLGGFQVCVVHGIFSCEDVFRDCPGEMGQADLPPPAPTVFYRCAGTAATGESALASLDDAISCAPVCFNRSLARAILSDVSQ